MVDVTDSQVRYVYETKQFVIEIHISYKMVTIANADITPTQNALVPVRIFRASLIVMLLVAPRLIMVKRSIDR